MNKPIRRFVFVSASVALAGTLLTAEDSFGRNAQGIAVSALLQGNAVPLSQWVSAAVIPGKAAPSQNTDATIPSPSNAPAVSVAALTNGGTVSLKSLVNLKVDPAVAEIKPADIKANDASLASLKQPAVEPAPVARVSFEDPAPNAVVVVPDVKPEAIFQPVALDTPTVVISLSADGASYSVKPDRLSFKKIGESIPVKIDGALPSDLALFVRDNAIAEFSKSGQSITARSIGGTELYVVAGGRMNIIPLTVKHSDQPFELKIPDTLLSLDGIVRGSAASALYPGIESVRESAQPAAGGFETADMQTDVGSEVSSIFYNENAKAQYQTLKLKIVDDRTPIGGNASGDASKAFPAPGVDVRVVGTKYSARTDASGNVEIPEIPRNARLMVRVQDQHGIYRPSVAEVVASQATQVIRVMRNFSFNGFADIAQSVQHAALGSLCVRMIDEESGAPIAGYRVVLDSQAEGPYYFNSYGFIDRGFIASGADGRACAFNVEPGPVSMTVMDGEAVVATLTKPVFAGYHVEDVVRFGSEGTFQIRLAALAPAAVQLNADVATANSYVPVDYADVMHFGFSDPMTYLDAGLLQSKDPVPVFGGRLSLAVQTADFEPSIYSIPVNHREPPVLALAPRGFVEDMAVFAQVTHEPTLGSVLVEYNHHESIRGESVTLKLVDHDNNARGEGWYFSDRPLTKALFFNVPAGVYQLQAETTDGYWLASQIVYVYNENMTYIRLGAPIKVGQPRP